ncbi:hypothetical protein QJS04_geneDACA019487 [Acorus gramineus]|uniref:CCHC-type domain-containing protein n=1 Tax=Acorus gramineus TaxID=55184 RepID=A0AAV9A9U9_ACOGR|nr:hypothetical protein QJS04_geneDACA019487 [Acorus gramineus]
MSVRCFRCVGWGHMARSCRDPLKCWHCGKLGHCSAFCKTAIEAINALSERRVEATKASRGAIQGEPRRPGSSKSVHTVWSPELATREEKFSRSLLLIW